MINVLAFGTFDPLHEGHVFFLEKAALLGDSLTVVVARDSQIVSQKKHVPYQRESFRVKAVEKLPFVSRALLGEDGGGYALLSKLSFDVLAVGYDQRPGDVEIREILASAHKTHVKVIRIPSLRPDIFSSSKMKAK